MKNIFRKCSCKQICKGWVFFFILGIGVSIGSGTFNELRAQETMDSPNMENPYITIPTIDAYYKGEKVWFIHTDVSDQGMREKLSMMVNHQTVFSSQIGKISIEKAGKLYVFTNGISQRGNMPWGGGPFFYQIDIFDSIPGEEQYTPLRNPHLVTWKKSVTPRILKSEEDLLEAEGKGELTIKKTTVIVNAPIVKWPGSYLNGTTLMKGKIKMKM